MIGYVIGVLALLAGVVAAVLLEVLLLAGSANSSPAQLLQIKAWMGGVALVALVSAVAGGWALVASRPWLAAGIGGVCVLLLVVAVVVMFATQG